MITAAHCHCQVQSGSRAPRSCGCRDNAVLACFRCNARALWVADLRQGCMGRAPMGLVAPAVVAAIPDVELKFARCAGWRGCICQCRYGVEELTESDRVAESDGSQARVLSLVGRTRIPGTQLSRAAVVCAAECPRPAWPASIVCVTP